MCRVPGRSALPSPGSAGASRRLRVVLRDGLIGDGLPGGDLAMACRRGAKGGEGVAIALGMATMVNPHH